MATRKLRDRIVGMVSDVPEQQQPEVRVPPVDKVGNLVEEAGRGFAAIQALYDDRNKSIELAQTLHRKVVYLTNVNVALRGDLQAARDERDHYMMLNAKISAWVTQAEDLIAMISREVVQTSKIVQQLAAPMPVSNNPDMPPLNSIGLPIEEEEKQPEQLPELPPLDAHFDTNGMPFANGPIPSHDDLRVIIEELQHREASRA